MHWIIVPLILILLLSPAAVVAGGIQNPHMPAIGIDIRPPMIVASTPTSVLVYEGVARDVILLDRSGWVYMPAGAKLVFALKKSETESILHTDSKTFSTGVKISFGTNLWGDAKLGVEFTESLAVGEINTITHIRLAEAAETHDLGCYAGDAYFSVVYLADIHYYTAHIYNPATGGYDISPVAVARDVVSRLVSVVDRHDTQQSDAPLRAFEGLEARYSLSYSPATGEYELLPAGKAGTEKYWRGRLDIDMRAWANSDGRTPDPCIRVTYLDADTHPIGGISVPITHGTAWIYIPRAAPPEWIDVSLTCALSPGATRHVHTGRYGASQRGRASPLPCCDVQGLPRPRQAGEGGRVCIAAYLLLLQGR